MVRVVVFEEDDEEENAHGDENGKELEAERKPVEEDIEEVR